MSEHVARKEAMGARDDQEVGVKEQGKWKKNKEKKMHKQKKQTVK